MALPTWPSTVPHVPEREPFAVVEYHRKPVASEVEDGPTIMRVQSQTRLKKLSYAIRMTAAQLATLETFLEVTCAQSTQHFTMPVFVGGETAMTRRCYVDGAEWRSEALAPDLWRVSFTLCVFPA
ncbi:hypothetical protein RHODGE_RHODGE_01036 [Rhodoplanes serenus]|uniref:Uncharacterized protein n=1 Tax=Rhodoplanes serenus TaxID=200615 RepID=A0A3S4B327_9BRAD|nr:hypothetical protein [Rhodoplanes serenus]VCU06571.1 hypothetical protein RHODPL_RHODPL_00019 [Rhodoplanes serenus]VCU07886.1 hypothetical protein RHODGE_RHODGE_01036 [Rhodoplanes serenus]